MNSQRRVLTNSASAKASLPVVYGTKPRLSNRFDELLLDPQTSRQQSPNQRIVPAQQQSIAATTDNSRSQRRISTRYAASNFKLEYPDGRVIQKSQEQRIVILDRGSLTERRFDMNNQGSVGTPMLHYPTESVEGDEVRVAPITHNMQQQPVRSSHPYSSQPTQVTRPTQRRTLNKMGSQSTAFSETSIKGKGTNVKPLFKRRANEPSNFKGASVAEISKQIKAKYSKDKRKTLVSELEPARRPSSYRQTQPVPEPVPTITVSTESMFRRQMGAPHRVIPTHVEETTGRGQTDHSQYSFKRNSYSAQLMEQRKVQPSSQSSLRYKPSQYGTSRQDPYGTTSTIIPPTPKKCTLQDNRCFGWGCTSFRPVDEYQMEPILDERGHNRSPIFR